VDVTANPGTRIRPAELADAEQIAQVHVKAWQSGYRGQMPQFFLDHLDPVSGAARWRLTIDNLSQSDDSMVVATAGEEVIGFAVFGPTRDQDQDPAVTGEVGALYLHPDAWGQGIGRQLMSEAIEQLTTAGYTRATLWVLGTNARARRFYAAAGFTEDGGRKVDDSRGFRLAELRYWKDLAR
jgi:ribosomal protein S18 acetylase RimI-like enzyme